MKYEKWIAATTFDTRRHPSLGPIDHALLQYKLKRTPEDLQRLGVAIREWQSGKKPPSDDTSAKVDQLKAWVERRVSELMVEQQSVLPEIQRAATVVFSRYQAWMDDGYKAAFESTFLGSADSGMRCYKYYSDRNSWDQHLISKLEATREIAPRIDAATPTLGMTESSSRNLAHGTPPQNRRVEFRPPINHHTLVHELLHWVCHESFRAKVEHYPVVKEGVTEWLAREALKEYTEGGWTEHYHTVDWGIDRKMIDADKMKRAYFAGGGLDSLFDDVIRVSSAHREDLRERTLDPDRDQRAAVASQAKQGGGPYRFSTTTSFSTRVLTLFKDQPDDVIREQLPKNWADWVIQKKSA